MAVGPLELALRSWSKFSTVNQRSCDGCFWKDGRGIYYDYERTSTPARISPHGNSFQVALLDPKLGLYRVLLAAEHGWLHELRTALPKRQWPSL
jgi:hypothetical protein